MADEEKMRPNIRIEIHNNISENVEMDVEENAKSENEEGELSDENDADDIELVSTKPLPEISKKQWPKIRGEFTTGINIFDKQEQEKLLERAKRFALKPEEIKNFTDTDLEQVHESLGLTIDNLNNVRFEAVHVLGTDNMSSEDVLEYFSKYAPTGIEWINEESCNVVWSENISAARAMFFISKVVKDMPARGPCDPFVKEFLADEPQEDETESTGQSILLKNKDREVELQIDVDLLLAPKKINYKNAAELSDITIPIPPGYWRLGHKHPKAKCLLMRFAFKTDKKPYKAEKFSKYYKIYGNPNYSGAKGIISDRKKKEMKGIFDRNRELNQDKSNPWGSLARNWNHDKKFCEPEPQIEETIPEIKNPNMFDRLGAKRHYESDDEVEEVEQEPEKEKKKTKMPRMKMYADEEEEKMKRRKILQRIKKQTEQITSEDKDLRTILGISRPRVAEVEAEVADLGTKLKNRTKSMVFTMERDYMEAQAHFERKENLRSDIRSLIEERRIMVPHRRFPLPPKRSEEIPERISTRRHRSPLRRSPLLRRCDRQSPSRRYSPESTLHSDRMYSSSRRRRENLDESHSAQRQVPRSKVAVVIKTPKKPTVASTIWSRVEKPSESESSGSSASEQSSSSGDSDSDLSEVSVGRKSKRPMFKEQPMFTSRKEPHRSPLKITMTNDRFKKESNISHN